MSSFDVGEVRREADEAFERANTEAKGGAAIDPAPVREIYENALEAQENEDWSVLRRGRDAGHIFQSQVQEGQQDLEIFLYASNGQVSTPWSSVFLASERWQEKVMMELANMEPYLALFHMRRCRDHGSAD